MKTAVITGAGSGVGRAVAQKLAQMSWNVALLGRREDPLQETAHECAIPEERYLVCPCDIGDAEAVIKVSVKVIEKFGRVDALVNCAGVNTPDRALHVLSVEEYRRVLRTNLDGAFHCIHAFLPQMRKQGEGTIVNINSDVGKRALEKAGAAYTTSKFGLTGLTDAINQEERRNGIRACGIYPGDINTPLLDRRPNPPPPEKREQMLQPEDLAECVALVVNLPQRAAVEEILMHPLLETST